MKIKCQFVSVWDGETELRSPAIYDNVSGQVEVLKTHEVIGPGVLDAEYIELEDGDNIKVCKTCHEFVMKECVIADKVGKGLHEEDYCRNPMCESRQ
jgi:hypothetical protein